MLLPWKEYVRYIKNVKDAFARRIEKRQVYLQALIDLEAKEQSHGKLIAAANVKEEDVLKSRAGLDRRKEHAVQSQSTFEAVSVQLLNDFEEFKLALQNDVKLILKAFITIKVFS